MASRFYTCSFYLKLKYIKMKKILIIISTFCSLAIIAQQEAMFTHYAFNTLAINPAYAGTRDALTVTALNRSQWVGFDGAPVIQTLTLHSPIFNEQLGLGVSLLNDNIGPTNNTKFNMDLSYKIKVSEKAKLSFGLKGGVNLMQAKLNGLNTEQTSDPSLLSVSNGLLPNFGFGVYYYTTKWYAGISTPNLIESELNTTSSTTANTASFKRHYFLIAGAVFNLNESLKLKPTTFVKVTSGAPSELDLTAMFILKDKIELGAMFRTGDAVGVLLGYNISNQFRLGYSFDWSYGVKTFKYNGGSHEVMLRYDFIKGSKNKIISPRYL